MIIKAEYQSLSRLEGHESQPKMKLWKQENAEFFLQNFDSSKLPQINQMLDGLNLQMHVSKSDIDDVNRQIESLFHSACSNTFGMTTPKKTIVKKSNKPWFNAGCRSARNLYHKTRRPYNRFKTDYYKNMLKTVCKNYKQVI